MNIDKDAPVFVAGHPGTTERQLTAADLRFRRDINLPASLLPSLVDKISGNWQICKSC